MKDVYVLIDENPEYEDYYPNPQTIGIFTTPEKALDVLNARGMKKHEIYVVPLDQLDRNELFRDETRCKIRACEFRLVTKPRGYDKQPTVIFERASRVDVIKAILNGGAILERNTLDEIYAIKKRETFPDDIYWGVPIKWEFGIMEHGPDNPDPTPPRVYKELPEPGLSELMTGHDLSGVL